MATAGTKKSKEVKANAAMLAAGIANITQKSQNDCPPDVEALGRATWTFLHSMAAQYPKKASDADQTEMKSFLTIFSKVYPCWHCAEDFRAWISKKGNEPKVGGREELGNWLCVAHNEVNRKLSKPIFDCAQWKARWRDGWTDGRCD